MQSHQGSLLLVDDDDVVRDLLARYLERNGFAITGVTDGNEALARIEEGGHDLVLLDILMDGLSGLEILEKVRRKLSATDLPVIMATSRDQSRDVVEALKLGANDYVTKPFDFPVVLARVQTQLALKRSVDRIRRLEQSLAQQNAELEQANRRMRRDLEAAARVQAALLPADQPSIPGAHLAWRFKPCNALAGDLLNVVPVDERRVVLYVLDVVDHGVKAALLAVMVTRVLAQLLRHAGLRPAEAAGPSPLRPAEVADHLDRVFPWDERTEQFLTLLYGILDVTTGEFRFVSAGHPGPLYLARGAVAQDLKVPGSPIGLVGGPHEENTLTLRPGDRLFLYSDGLPDARNVQGQPFGMGRVREALERSRAVPLSDSLAVLWKDLEEWCGSAGPHDDITTLAAEFTGLLS